MQEPADPRSTPPTESAVVPFAWRYFRPTPLALGFTLAVIAVMIGLGLFIIAKYRELQLHSYGEIGSVYIDSLLAPYAISHSSDESGDPARMRQDIDDVFAYLSEPQASMALQIWLPDGSLLYSSISMLPEQHDSHDLDLALQGQFVSQLVVSATPGQDFPVTYPFLEVYAPIHDPVTGALVAVGEIYQDASEILRDRAFFERTIWTATALATVGVLSMLALSMSQSEKLRQRLERERWMTQQNDLLRRDANRARLEAAQANEQVLNIVGAELHDGPVQLLGLMSLMGHDSATATLPDGTTLRALTEQVQIELRRISAGLILPELQDLDAAAVVDLAIGRHRALTGRDVRLAQVQLDADLDLPRKICLYRILQEGLTNAVRHGDDTIPIVSIRVQGKALDILIRNGRSASVERDKIFPPVDRLGLQAMRRRLQAFGGTLALDHADVETQLRVTLPLRGENMPDQSIS